MFSDAVINDINRLARFLSFDQTGEKGHREPLRC